MSDDATTTTPEVISPEEREDAQYITRREAARDAIRFLRRRKNAVLSTLSKRHGGWPFGSVAPYALDARGEPLLFISTIAEHTKNIRNDPRVSLLVQDDAPDGDQQATGRITLMGRASVVPEPDLRDARARYVEKIPGAASYESMHDFALHRISLEHVRFIGGFGRIFWLEAKELLEDPVTDPLASGAKGVLDHMNADHGDALLLYCRAFKQVSPSRATMVGVDQWGFDVECTSPDVRLRFDFPEAATMETIRKLVVDMVKLARERLAAAETKA